MPITYFVSPTGNDLADGLSLPTALATVARAAALWTAQSAAIQSGPSYIKIASGTYHESAQIYLQPKVNTTGTLLVQPLSLPTLPSGSNAPVKIYAYATSEGGIYAWSAANSGNSNSPYMGITVFNVEVTDGTSLGTLPVGISIATPNSGALACYVHDVGNNLGNGATGAGIDNTGVGDGLNPFGFFAVGNRVIHCGPTAGGANYNGIYLNSYAARAINNLVGDTPAGVGITAWHNATNLEILNNTVFGGALEGITWGSSTVDCLSCKIFNNISYGNGGYGFADGSGGGHVTNFSSLSSNIAFNNTSGDAHLTDTTYNNYAMTHADPLFVNYQANGSGDYHLTASSPAIDNGTGLDSPATDFDGNPRPLGYYYDIGCYEYVPGYGSWIMQDSSGDAMVQLVPYSAGPSFWHGVADMVGVQDSSNASANRGKIYEGNTNPYSYDTVPDGSIWLNDNPSSTNQYTTVGPSGSTPHNYANWYSGLNNQKWVSWPSTLTGTITSISFYADGVGSAATFWGCVWSTTGTLLGQTGSGAFNSGSESIAGQHWHTLSGIAVAITSATTYRVGVQCDTTHLVAWSCYGSNQSPFTGFGYNDGGATPGNLGSASTPSENFPPGIYFVVQTSATTQAHVSIARGGVWVTVVA